MFSNRFIKAPIDLYNKKEAEMVGYGKSTKEGVSVMSFLALEVSHYRPAFDDNDEEIYTLIYMKGGESFILSINIAEFEKLLNAI